MCRVLAYLDHKASRWTILATSHGRTVSSQLDEGLHAYAKKQAQLLRDMAQSFEMKWAILQANQLTVEELKRLQHPQEHRKKRVNAESQQDYDVPMGNDTGSKGEDADDADDGNDALLD